MSEIIVSARVEVRPQDVLASLDEEELVRFIIQLDKHAQSWDVTKPLYDYFKKVYDENKHELGE